MQKAIDIVLIPPDAIQQKCIEYNQLIKPKHIQLNTTNQLPHISLLMGGANNDTLDQAQHKLATIVDTFNPLKLEIYDVHTGGASVLSVRITDELYNLHKQIVEHISPLLQYDNELASVYDHANALPKTLKWINNFMENSALEKFDPHITIGDAELTRNNVELPLHFIVDRIAICHLGNLCTCREVLFELQLN